MVREALVSVVFRATLGAAALISAIAPGPARAAATVPAVAEVKKDTPEAAFERYRELINTHDFDRLAEEVVADDALFVFTDKVHRGMDEVRAAFNRTWSVLPDEVYTMTDAEWLTRDRDSAVVVFRYSYKGTLKNGQTLSGGGHGTNLYKRTPAGWRLAYEHLSHDPKPAPAS